MKKFFLFCAALLAVSAGAETITLDLSTAENAAYQKINYETKDIPCYLGNLKDVMDSTFSEAAEYNKFTCNNTKFSFMHLPSQSSWGGTSWEGFTLSKVASDTLNQFACMAKGGLKGEGTPFVVGYYSEYFNNPSKDQISNFVIFLGEFYPAEVAICQSAYTYKALTEGYVSARKFTDKDTLTLVISAYDDEKGLTNSVDYYLAVDGKFNKGWETVDLSSLGKCSGLVFSMKSTDTGAYGTNTPTYFALDGLKISTEPITAIENQTVSAPATKRIVNGVLVIERNGVLYNAAGQVINK